jgi:putative ABC transport system permease protein
MIPLRHFLLLALQALLRNRMQTALAILGMTVGVGALVTSVALGRGAQDAISDQLRAAGANVIVVTAGNYQKKREVRTDNVVEGRLEERDLPSVLRPAPVAQAVMVARQRGRGGVYRAVWKPQAAAAHGRLIRVHFEDDPMAHHDHPTAAERLGDAMAGLGAAATLTRADAEAIRREIPGVQFVASGVHENARVYGEGQQDHKWFTRMHGTEADLPEIRSGWIFPHGRFISQKEIDGADEVMVLGRVVADRLFGPQTDPVGRQVFLWNQPFKVIGVVSSRNWATQPAPGDDQFDAVYVPVSTVHKLLNLSRLNTITITTASVGDTTRIAKQVAALLRKRHKIGETMADDFTVQTQAQQVLGRGLSPDLAYAVAGNMASVDQLTIEQLSISLKRANGTMLGLLASVATVSLLVGGIGVMNLLLLSVTQRTREVGLRMAVGARRSDVAAQFVLEALLLSLAGGLLGVLLGVLASGGLEQFFKWSAVISPLSAMLAIVVAAALGVAFGVYPARRAALLDPIEALRHE